MTNMYFQVCSFFYMLVILIIFFRKKRVNNGETKIFGILSVINILGIALDIYIVYLSYVTPGCWLLYVLNKIYLIYILYWTTFFSIYISYINKMRLSLPVFSNSSYMDINGNYYLEFIDEDELLEVTPTSLRIRKIILYHVQRGRMDFRKKNNQ